MIVLGIGLHCSGNSQRWRNGGVLGAGKIWKKCPDGKHRLAARGLAARCKRSGRAAAG